MKKNATIGVIAALVLAYPAATWWTGKRVETALAKQYDLLKDIAFVKVVQRDFKRGFASSTETVTYELFGDMLRNAGGAKKESLDESADAATAAQAPPKPLQFTLHSRIKHGPIAGGFAAAAVDTELLLDDETKREIAKVLGDGPPLTLRTVFGYGGGGRSTLSSPAFATTFAAQDGVSNRVTWEGFKADVDFASGLRSYRLSAAAPKLEVQDAKGANMRMAGLRLEAQQQRIFDDEPLLYAGTQKFSFAQIDINGAGTQDKAVSIKDVVYDINMPVTGEFVDMSAKLGAASLLIDKEQYGPARYEFSLKHLHARTTAKLYRAMMSLYSSGLAQTQQTDPTRAMKALAEPAMELLKHSPEFALERISFRSPQGEAVIAGNVKLVGAKPEDFANMFAMIGKVDARADLTLPEAMLAEMGTAKARSVEERDMQRQMFAAQLKAFSDQGYVTRDGGMVKSRLAFRNGEFTVNGKPFNPMAAGPNAAAPMDEHGDGSPALEQLGPAKPEAD